MYRQDNYTTKVRQFHQAFGHALDQKHPTVALVNLRQTLVGEEAEEVRIAFSEYQDHLLKFGSNKPEEETALREQLLGELADLLVVTFGAAEALGLEICEAYNRKMKANMSKLGENGKPVLRPDGKILKGPNFKEATMEGLV